MDCVFCTGEDPVSRKVGEHGLAWAFLTYTPIVPGHTLVIPRRHVKDVRALTEEEWRDIRTLIGKVQKALAAEFDAFGFNVAFNEGEKAGQSVPHFHVHVVPRTPGDAGVVQYEPRDFLYRPGSRAPSPSEELREVAEALRTALGTVA